MPPIPKPQPNGGPERARSSVGSNVDFTAGSAADYAAGGSLFEELERLARLQHQRAQQERVQQQRGMLGEGGWWNGDGCVESSSGGLSGVGAGEVAYQGGADLGTDAALLYWSEGARTHRLAKVCNRVLSQQAYLMDHQFLCARTAAVLTREMIMGGLGLGNCEAQAMEDCAREALQDALLEDEKRYRAGWIPQRIQDSRYYFLIHQFAVEEHLALPGAVRFNRLPDWSRQAFRALILEGRSIQECLNLGYGPSDRFKLEVRRGLKAVLFLEDLWSEIQIPGKRMEEHPRG